MLASGTEGIVDLACHRLLVEAAVADLQKEAPIVGNRPLLFWSRFWSYLGAGFMAMPAAQCLVG